MWRAVTWFKIIILSIRLSPTTTTLSVELVPVPSRSESSTTHTWSWFIERFYHRYIVYVYDIHTLLCFIMIHSQMSLVSAHFHIKKRRLLTMRNLSHQMKIVRDLVSQFPSYWCMIIMIAIPFHITTFHHFSWVNSCSWSWDPCTTPHSFCDETETHLAVS